TPSAILIEDKASGQSLIQELQRATRLPVLPVKVDRDKIARASAITPLIESGRVLLPESAPWVSDFIEECSSFPVGAHDDRVDSMTQALDYLSHKAPPKLVFGGLPI
ncbi:MAG: phage terminase large subunit, partial [Thiomonas sp.]